MCDWTRDVKKNNLKTSVAGNAKDKESQLGHQLFYQGIQLAYLSNPLMSFGENEHET